MPIAFAAEESGAMTVDWTVLTAALVGLGLASGLVVSAGVQNTSNDIDAALRGDMIVDIFDQVFASNDFTDGVRGDWIGGVVTDIPGFGEVLALSGDARMAELPITVGGRHDYARIEFDMILGDSWDGETGAILINGETMVLGSMNHQTAGANMQTFEGPDGATVEFLREDVVTGTGAPNWTGQQDYSYRVRITQANDGRPIQLGASTTLQQGARDEFFAIDNLQVTGVSDP